VNQVVGVFVLLTLIIFVAALFSSRQVREWMDPGAKLKVVLPTDGLFGLSEGADVEILGTKAGTVRRIVINPDRQMHAIVRIQSNMEAFVRQESIALIRKRFGVAGDAYLDISRGVGEPLDWEYAVINAKADRAPTDTIGDLIDEVRSKIFPVIDDTQEAIQIFLAVVEDLQDPKGDMQQLLVNLNSISGKISRGEGVVGRLLYEDQLVDDVEQIVGLLNRNIKRLEPLFDDLKTTIANISGITAKINEQSGDFPEITKSLKEVLASVQAVMEDLSRATPQLPHIAKNVEDSTDNLPVLLLQTQQVMAELEQLLTQLQSHWLLGGKRSTPAQASGRLSPQEVRP